MESTPPLSVFSFQLSTSKGCDNIVTLQLIVNDLPNVVISGESSFCEGGSTELTASGANSYVWSNGDKTAATTVSKADNYSVIGTDGNGCTNSASLLVSTNPIYNISLTETICRNELPYRYVNGKIDTTFLENTPQLSVFSFQLSTSKGCDSIITLQLTLIPTTYGDTAAIACETFSWYEYSTLTESGDYTHTLSNAAGCDSVVTLHLTINHNVYNEISAITADSCYIWNDSTYCQSGDYIQIFEADNNCDSIVTLHLLITVGINHYSQTNEIVVYPNPTTGMLTIRGDNMSLLQLTDVQGRLLQTWRASDRTMQINLSAYPTGLYLLRIHGNKQSWTYKIIKQ